MSKKAELTGGLGGGITFAVAGFNVGKHIGIVLGPIGGFNGGLICAVIFGVIGTLGGDRIGLEIDRKS